VPASFGTTQTFVSATRFCQITQPFQPQVKLLGSYALPWWNLMISGTFQSLPGPEIEANWAVTSAQIAPSLSRPLAQGPTATVSVPLIRPWSVFGDRLNQIDFRLGKRFRAGPYRFTGQFDLYNLLNANPVLSLNNTYGSAWLTPVNILPGRLFKAGIELTF
jgi:outer membrane receptor protein involved in Fe transport